ncbi:ribose operon repressor [Peptococcaceae bacterium CEB3]|nr:ribose operon repressor [Peptococcaceae bacterium CEB3]
MAKAVRRPTMEDVAKLAGVTQPTVSYVINGTANISEEVTSRVHAAIATLGYQPNMLAKNLKTRATETIGFLVPDITNIYYSTITKGVERALRERGYLAFLAVTGYDMKVEQRYVKSFIQHNVAGIIVAYSPSDEKLYEFIEHTRIPLLVMDDQPLNPNIPTVQLCNEEGGRLATEHLISLGHKKIAFASEPLVKYPLHQRLQGYENALNKAGLPISSEHILIAEKQPNIFEMGYNLGCRLLRADVNAVFATSDHLAFGIIKALTENNIRVPEDISVIGYDDVPMADMITPPLTTVAQPMEAMAAKGAELLLDIITGVPCETQVTLLPSLMIRKTTAKKDNSCAVVRKG